MKEDLIKQIKQLREEGKSYNEISKTLSCSKGLISYHCGNNVKNKQLERQSKTKQNYTVNKRVNSFKRRIPNQGSHKGKLTVSNSIEYGIKDVLQKIGNNPVCYLTGDKI